MYYIALQRSGVVNSPTRHHACCCAEDAELDSYKAQLENAKNVPEQLFGDSFLRLSHAASGVCLEFTALDALQAWRKDDRPPVRVGAAEDWLKSRQKDVEASGAVSFEYDWCAMCYMIGRHV